LNDRNSDHIGEFKQKSISLGWLIIWPIKVVYMNNPGLPNMMQVYVALNNNTNLLYKGDTPPLFEVKMSQGDV
jgi:hypothetical protein